MNNRRHLRPCTMGPVTDMLTDIRPCRQDYELVHPYPCKRAVCACMTDRSGCANCTLQRAIANAIHGKAYAPAHEAPQPTRWTSALSEARPSSSHMTAAAMKNNFRTAISQLPLQIFKSYNIQVSRIRFGNKRSKANAYRSKPCVWQTVFVPPRSSFGRELGWSRTRNPALNTAG